MNNFEENTEFCNEADSLYSISDTTKLKALLEDMEDKWSFNHIDDIFGKIHVIDSLCIIDIFYVFLI